MDKNSEKKFIQSPVAIICYVLAAIMLIYACFQAGSTVQQINEYYSGYGMTAKPSEYIAYVLQAMMQPLLYAVTIFMLGYILNAVRKMNPDNYKTAEELMAIDAARKEAKAKKQSAKGEVKADKSGDAEVKDDAVRTDFAESLEAELKADAKASGTAPGRSRKSSGNSTRKASGTRGRSNAKSAGSGNGGRSNASKSAGTKSSTAKAGTKSSTAKAGTKSSTAKDGTKSGEAKDGTKSGEAKSKSSAAKSRSRSEAGRNTAAAAEKVENEVKNETKNEAAVVDAPKNEN